MEKSINSRFYFDYNATSPLAKKVQDFLHDGDFLFGNPASLHLTGKNSKKFITETRNSLFKIFNLSADEFELYFHSGATEGINNYFKGNALKYFSQKKSISFFFSSVDHQAIINLEEDLKLLGHNVFYFEINSDGEFDKNLLLKNILDEEKKNKNVFLNYTVINNESGVVWPLDFISEIKTKTSTIVHVDAVQLVGKIENWDKLNPLVDAYTFSGHKFGSLKGVGFSFIKKMSPYKALITGGNQQFGLRSGTENALGIYSIKLALEEIIENFNASELKSAKEFIEVEILNFLKEKANIVAYNSSFRNLNTIFLIIKNSKAELVSMKFDMNQIDISTGSACSSGIIKENRVLLSMGYTKEESKSAVRFSFSPFMTLKDAQNYSKKIIDVLAKLP